MSYRTMAALVVLVTACSLTPAAVSPSPSPPPTTSASGLSAEDAAALALANAGAAATEVAWIDHGPLNRFVEVGTLNVDFRRLVWAARVSGQFAGSCVPGRACPPDSTSALVILDYYTGEFITEMLSN